MTNLAIAILGSTKGTDMQAIIDAIERKELDAEIVLAASDRQDAYILERAKKHGIETLAVDYKKFPRREDAERTIVAKLREKNAQLIILIGFMRILSPTFVGEFRGRLWNIHPSLLPKYGGRMSLDVHAEVLRNHDTLTGCTLHEVTEEVDAGRVIMQKKCIVAPEHTPEGLKLKVQKLEQECILEAIKMVTEGKLSIGGH